MGVAITEVIMEVAIMAEAGIVEAEEIAAIVETNGKSFKI
jgi:hypothetical protein